MDRQRRILDRTRSWPVKVDGRIVASLRNSETVDIPVEELTHSVRVGTDGLASPTQTFGFGGGEGVEFVCRQRAPSPLIWHPYRVAALFRRDLLVELNRAQTIAGRVSSGARPSPLADGVRADQGAPCW